MKMYYVLAFHVSHRGPEVEINTKLSTKEPDRHEFKSQLLPARGARLGDRRSP